MSSVLAGQLRRTATILGLLALIALGGFSPGPVAGASTFTVNSTADAVDAVPGDGICDTVVGPPVICTLRAAIEEANALAGADTIAFDIPGAGPHTIQPASALPTITDPIIIDGYTQPGASPNTNGPGLGLNTVLKIELEGSNAGFCPNGLRITAGNSTVRGLVINRFAPCTGTAGIKMEANGGNVIEGNFIGTDVTGTIALPNSATGLWIEDVPNNVIGGIRPEARNLISGNGIGVRIQGSDTAGNMLQGNFIGTDVTGTVDLGNAEEGVAIFGAPDNTIGGTTAGARNIISGNGSGGGRDGVAIWFSANGNTVQGNFIGTDVTGTADLGNGRDGVSIFAAPDNTVGGTTPGAGNVVSGNEGAGVRIIGEGANGNIVQGNFIGTDAAGTAAIGNTFYGGVVIDFSASYNTIGGTTPGAGNVISANGGGGVFMDSPGGPATLGNVVQGNFIGTDVTGTADLGNAGFGIFIAHRADDNTIGGAAAGAGNTIAFNNGPGVVVGSSNAVISGTGNAVLSNAVYSNTGLGIDVGPSGVTPNDSGDGDTGANGLQNFPELTLAASGSTAVEGTLNSTSDTEFRIEFFSNSACDPSSHGEGENFLGSTMVTTDGSGNATVSVLFGAAVPVGHFITATATDPDNNTSEFSQCIQVTQAPTPTPTATPRPVGGVALDSDLRPLPLETGDSSPSNVGVLIGIAVATALTISGAALIVRRKLSG